MKKLLAAAGISLALVVAPAAGIAGAADAPAQHTPLPQSVISSVVGAVDQKLDDAVAAGQLDAARATKIKDRLQQRATNLMNGERGPRAKARGLIRHARRGAVVLAAKTIGVEPKAIVAARRDGKSVADVARAHDVDPQKVVDALVTAATKKIDDALANGKVSTNRAATAKERLSTRVTKLVNATGSAHRAK